MLDANLQTQLRGHFTALRQPIELVATLADDAASGEMRILLDQLASLSDKITVRYQAATAPGERAPSFAINRLGEETGVRFAGLPMGHEFTSLVLALLQVGGHPPRVEAAVLDQIRALRGPLRFETYFSQSCQNCPDVVQALNLISALNPEISHVAIDGALFPDEVEARGVMAVPTVLLDGQPFAQGRMTLEQILARLDTGAAVRTAADIDAKIAFDMLVVGGGPAGAAASIYAARKGIHTGLVAERFGGQLLDTVGIENFISTPRTEGLKLAGGLDLHVKDYAVDVMDLQKAVGLTPAAEPGGLITLSLESGATLKSRAVILSTGARWRQMNVPGEDLYRNRGVAYCPHCDGPLYRGKRVAVVGGGNSGVEAAIDLAGIVDHVTLVEFDGALRADAVLQRKLASLANVTVLTSSCITEVIGDGAKVTGATLLDRATDQSRTVPLEGVFVQIGLVPNTEWLKGVVDLTPRGEILVDERGQTSVPGVFAAGDATTVPFKQIVIAMGEGSKAALSAFDYLIRLAPAESLAA